jgi:hypothetical protein
MSVTLTMNVNSLGISRCVDSETQTCKDRNNHSERYCINYGDEDPSCDHVFIIALMLCP